jgi:hypothetical protein
VLVTISVTVYESQKNSSFESSEILQEHSLKTIVEGFIYMFVFLCKLFIFHLSYNLDPVVM